ncbi:LEA type 2 family protein [Geobacter hydrogenophilus]|uniref:WHy domain-containing lipoprotein n=1 Tax=Geobacter hydrogenophilus TaxID=40983 RepID=A0A9W6G2N2_9BACT|nr:LEA type 2 family protein [Geobacter hydrogenophilus]MBT0892433.1 LEA type 2 family protein [Geobacter hydrogenophilus]GLI39830.1 WHy domain-containing lipoprotein [Geobacter hydrogenophilus]
MRKLLILVVCLIFCAGCSLILDKPEVKVRDLNVVGIGVEGVELEFLLTVTNPNSFPLVLNGYTYDLNVMALPLTKGGKRERIEFPADKATDVRLPFKVAYGDLWEILKRQPDQNKIPYRLNAGLEVETPFGTTTVPVSKESEFAVPERYRTSGILKGVTDLLKGFRQ